MYAYVQRHNYFLGPRLCERMYSQLVAEATPEAG